MGTTSRKQREIQQREQLLLDVGRRMLIEQGFAGLSMDRLAEATEYSKGTIYQHFSTKEDLVTALAVQSVERRLELFGRAERFVGRPRERMVAIAVADELFARLHPHYFRSELIIKMASLQDRASAGRLDSWEQLDSCCFGMVRRLIAEAIAAGDLALPPDRSPDEILFSLFALVIGTHTVMLNHARIFAEWELGTPYRAFRRAMDTMLDGLGMHPLATDWDYEATRQRVLNEVFADEQRTDGPA